MDEQLREHWQERRKRKAAEEKERRELAFKKALLVAGKLKEKYGVHKVYLYGSLVWNKHYGPMSDIDMLIEGFPAEENYWAALAEMEHLAAPFPLQLVLKESAHQSLVDRIYREGKLL